MQLLDKKLSEVEAIRKLNDDIETPLVSVLVEMENNGIAVDPAILKKQSEVLAVRVEGTSPADSQARWWRIQYRFDQATRDTAV